MKQEHQDSPQVRRCNPANIITALRMVFAAGLLTCTAFSAAFWCWYLLGGLSDMLDGFAARKLHLQSDAGARLDSTADILFGAALAVVLLKTIFLPHWLLLWAAAIALLRMIGYAIGFYKYHAFCALHTYANKLTGALIFAFPVLYMLLGMERTGLLLCVIASFSALEELLITVTAAVLNRDRRSLFLP